VNPPAAGWSLTVPPPLWTDLMGHLFPGDDHGHGAVVLADLADGPRGPRLLARELIPAIDGTDYLSGGGRGHRLTAEFVRDAAVRARDTGRAYLAVHCHGGLHHVDFSPTDLASHQRGYPTLRQITGQIVGGLVFTPHAAAGDLWLPNGGRAELAEVVVPAGNLLRLRATPAVAQAADPTHDRQARLFGDLGQDTLQRLRVGVVGLGGVGSILVELLARLGVGDLVLIDDDTVDGTNLPRLLAAEPDDIGEPKTDLAVRNARRANPAIHLQPIRRPVQHPEAQRALTTCDWIFLAADSHAARHTINATVHKQLIPATQVGVKIPVDCHGDVGQVHAVVRLIAPGVGCLWCNGLIDATELAIEMLPDADRPAARYVPDVPAPSVIALNALAAAEAINHFMLAVTGLHTDEFDQAAVLYRPRSRERDLQDPRTGEGCSWCRPTG
jgi:molybdopterin/thiamine biosynthesis adenylyltransferase